MERPPIHQPEPPVMPLYRRLFHWGPIVAMSIVTIITITSIYCHLMWWPPERSLAGFLDLVVFLFWNYFCLSNLLQASYVGPGYVPLEWIPPNIEDVPQYLQFCEHCNGFKPPRAHHCRQCKRCVMKMDHHCPWINNCCGHKNHGYFVAFLLSAVFGCTHATIILGSSIYYAVFRVWYYYYGTGREPKVELGLYGLFAAVFSFGLAVGVIVAVGFLFMIQMRSILRNRTGIEDYILSKALQRERHDEFIYPYDLGWKRNLQQVFTRNLVPLSDGIYWTVKDGCDQYALTMEQIEQKRLKRLLAMEYVAVKPYNGGLCISRQDGGCGAFCSQPCFTGDGRLQLKESDRIMVNRWRRHWFYGEKKVEQQLANDIFDGSTRVTKIQRGWFPRRCVMEVTSDDPNTNTPASQSVSGMDSGNSAEPSISVGCTGKVEVSVNNHPKAD